MSSHKTRAEQSNANECHHTSASFASFRRPNADQAPVRLDCLGLTFVCSGWLRLKCERRLHPAPLTSIYCSDTLIMLKTSTLRWRPCSSCSPLAAAVRAASTTSSDAAANNVVKSLQQGLKEAMRAKNKPRAQVLKVCSCCVHCGFCSSS